MTIEAAETVTNTPLFTPTFNQSNMPLSLALPQLNTFSFSHLGEIARWFLTLQQLPYSELFSVRQFLVPKISLQPSFFWGDRCWGGVEDISKPFIEHMSLLPELSQVTIENAEEEKLRRLFLGEFADAITAVNIVLMLEEPRVMAKAIEFEIPSVEKPLLKLLFPIWRRSIAKQFGIKKSRIKHYQHSVDAVFAQVSDLLADGRSYLGGEHFSYLDIYFSALAASVIFPKNYLGSLPELKQLPNSYRQWIAKLQASNAGKHCYFIYEKLNDVESTKIDEFTGELPQIAQLRAAAQRTLFSPRVLKPAFWVMRRWQPVVKIKNIAILANHDDVVEALENPAEVSVVPVYAERMQRNSGDFVLGMDPCPMHTREKELLNQAVLNDDLAKLQEMTRAYIQQILHERRPIRRLDIVQDYNRLVVLKIIVEEYFGFKSGNDALTVHWIKSVFNDIFHNAADNLAIKKTALQAGEQMSESLRESIRLHKQNMAAGEETKDTVIGRFLQQQAQISWLDDESIRRNVSGLIVGCLETVNQAVVNIMQELFKRPAMLALARSYAQRNDDGGLLAFCHEALRLNPCTPLLLRECKKDWKVGAARGEETKLKQGTGLFIGIVSATHDENHYRDALEFNAGRNKPNFQLGHGVHLCQGSHLSDVLMMEMVRGLLLLKNLKPASGKDGRLSFTGSLPNRWILNFDY